MPNTNFYSRHDFKRKRDIENIDRKQLQGNKRPKGKKADNA